MSNGTLSDGTPDKTPFNAVNFISFTATPYANVLNEAFESSLYPKDFICTLSESKEYFGSKVIFGSDFDDKYRGGYELLQRIWLPDSVQEKFEFLEKIDEKLKAEMQDFMDKGRSPANYGPKIMNSATIAKFRITAKNKSQMAEECDFYFSGDSYETTKFYDDATALEDNLHLTDAFLNSLGAPRASDVSASAYVWHGIDYATIGNTVEGSRKN